MIGATPTPVISCITAIAARSICRSAYTERLADAGIGLSVGSRGDAYDNALAETVIGLFKTEVIRRRGPWRSLEAVEFATLEWVDWFNHRGTRSSLTNAVIASLASQGVFRSTPPESQARDPTPGS